MLEPKRLHPVTLSPRHQHCNRSPCYREHPHGCSSCVKLHPQNATMHTIKTAIEKHNTYVLAGRRLYKTGCRCTQISLSNAGFRQPVACINQRPNIHAQTMTSPSWHRHPAVDNFFLLTLEMERLSDLFLHSGDGMYMLCLLMPTLKC